MHQIPIFFLAALWCACCLQICCSGERSHSLHQRTEHIDFFSLLFGCQRWNKNFGHNTFWIKHLYPNKNEKKIIKLVRSLRRSHQKCSEKLVSQNSQSNILFCIAAKTVGSNLSRKETVGYLRDISRPPTLLKMPFRKMKTFFFFKILVSSSYFLTFQI